MGDSRRDTGEGLPEPHLDLGWVGHEHALEDLGEVPQVEGVVGLGWRGQQLGGNGGVHHDGSFHEGIREVGDVGGPGYEHRSGPGSHRQELPVQPLKILAPALAGAVFSPRHPFFGWHAWTPPPFGSSRMPSPPPGLPDVPPLMVGSLPLLHSHY